MFEILKQQKQTAETKDSCVYCSVCGISSKEVMIGLKEPTDLQSDFVPYCDKHYPEEKLDLYYDRDVIGKHFPNAQESFDKFLNGQKQKLEKKINSYLDKMDAVEKRVADLDIEKPLKEQIAKRVDELDFTSTMREEINKQIPSLSKEARQELNKGLKELLSTWKSRGQEFLNKKFKSLSKQYNSRMDKQIDKVKKSKPRKPQKVEQKKPQPDEMG